MPETNEGLHVVYISASPGHAGCLPSQAWISLLASEQRVYLDESHRTCQLNSDTGHVHEGLVVVPHSGRSISR